MDCIYSVVATRDISISWMRYKNEIDRGKSMGSIETLVKVYNSFQYVKEIEDYNGIIYHYSSPEGVKGILDSKALFATDMYYLNDASEGRYVISIIEENIENLCHDNSNFISQVKHEIEMLKEEKWEEMLHNYTISFSLDGDSLEMWNYYTKGNSIQGYNIGFDSRMLSETASIEILDDDGKIIERDEKKHLSMLAGKVIYNEEEQIQILYRIFDAFYKLYPQNTENEFGKLVARYVVQKAVQVGKFFKSPKFAVEKEYRVLFSTYLLNDQKSAIQGIPHQEFYRVHEGCFVPYQKVIFSIASIKEITFSPSLHNEMTEAGLKRMMKQKGMEEVRVKKSDIPLRF